MKKSLWAIFFMFACILLANSAIGQTSLNSRLVFTNIMITDDNGQPFTQKNPAFSNANVRIYIDWVLHNDWGVKNGDYCTYILPEYFSVHNSVSDILADPEANINYGSFNLGMGSTEVKLTFNSNAENRDVKGKLFLSTSFKQINVSSSDTIKTGIFDEMGQEILIFLGFKNGSIKKTGAYQGNNVIKWAITINDSLSVIKNGKITDTIPAGLTYNAGSVSGLPSGSVAGLTSLSGGKSLLTITLPATLAPQAYTINYTTTVNNPLLNTFTNSACFSGDNIYPVNDKATVNTNNEATIKKSLINSIDSNGQLEWQIEYFADQKNSWLIDQLWINTNNKGTHYLIENSVKVYTVDASSVETLYSGWAFDAAGEEFSNGNIIKFKIDFKNNLAPLLFRVKYKTQATVFPVINTTIFENKVTTSDNKTATASSNKTITTISKVWSSTDNVNQTHSWTTTVNSSGITMKDLVITDTLTAGMEFIEASLVINANLTSTLIKGTHYTVAPYKGDYKKGFVVIFLAPYNNTTAKFTLTYKTSFDLSLCTPGAYFYYTNRAIINFIDNLDSQKQNSAYATANTNNEQRTNGYKAGLYIPKNTTLASSPYDGAASYTSATNGSIVWLIGFNQNSLTIKNAVIADVLQSKQQYASGTLYVFNASTKSDGSLAPSTKMTDGADYNFENISGNGNSDTLRIKFTNDVTGPVLVYFITTLDNAVHQDSYSNTATLTASNMAKWTWSTAVAVSKPANWLDKTGRQGDETKGEDPFKIYWSVVINKNSETIEDAVLRDSLDSKQKLITDSNGKLDINIYSTKLSGANLVKDQLLTEGTDYTLIYSLSGTTGIEKFAVHFLPNPITSPYIVEYTSQILVANNEIIKNYASFSGKSLSVISSVKTITVKLTAGQGQAQGQNGSITINKVSNTNSSLFLADATFELYNSGSTQMLRTVTTDVNGQVKVENLNFGTYRIKETKAPAGYRLATTEWTVTISNTEPDATIIITDTLKSRISTIFSLSVNGDVIDVSGGGPSFSYSLLCGADTALVLATAADHGTVWFEGSNKPNTIYFPNINKAGYTNVPFKTISEDSSTVTYYTIDIIHPFDPSIVVQYWDEVLTANNNTMTNGGYKFNGYQWGKNGVLLQGKIDNILRVPEKLNPADSYFAILTTNAGWSAPSCPMHPKPTPQAVSGNNILAYPNPARAGQLIKIQTGLKENFTEKSQLYIYDLSGKLISIQPVSGKEADINAPSMAGSYILKMQTSEGASIFNIVVIP